VSTATTSIQRENMFLEYYLPFRHGEVSFNNTYIHHFYKVNQTKRNGSTSIHQQNYALILCKPDTISSLVFKGRLENMQV
jgi:hypothetical protein